MNTKGFHSAENHRLPANRSVLLGSARTGAQAASCGDENGGSPRRMGHAIGRLEWSFAKGLKALPLSRSCREDRAIPAGWA
jgi:hypothetical protein